MQVGFFHLRTGTATLELVLSMPILLALMVGVIWLGSSVIAQTEVTITARHKTWKKRDDVQGTALLFLKDNVIRDEATQDVSVSPLFDDTEPPESEHNIMAAAWDSEALPLNQAPHWKEYAKAAANAKTAGLQTGYVNAQNQFTNFKNDSRKIWSQIGAAMIRQLANLGDSANDQLEGGENSGSDEKEALRNRLQRQLESKKNQLKQAREDRKNLAEDASDALRDTIKNRIRRLQSEIKDLEDDLEALDS